MFCDRLSAPEGVSILVFRVTGECRLEGFQQFGFGHRFEEKVFSADLNGAHARCNIPVPVKKTIGKPCRNCSRHFCNSSPFRPGISTSQLRPAKANGGLIVRHYLEEVSRAAPK